MGFSYSSSKEKDGKLKFCIDLSKLNSRTMKDSYSLPRIEHVLDQLVGSAILLLRFESWLLASGNG